MTPEDLRKMADELDEQARAAFRRGDEAEAMKLVRQSWVARDAADEREQALSGLPRRVNKRTVNTVMTSAHKVAISAGRAPKNKLAAAARDAGLTMRDLAKRLGVSLALISMATRGERSIKRELALEIEKLTGYRVSNWRSLS